MHINSTLTKPASGCETIAWPAPLGGEIVQGLDDAFLASSAVNVSVPEEMDGKLTKEIIEEYGLKSSASMV